MSMDESRFVALVGETLEHMADVIDEVLGDRVEAEYQGGILTLELDDGGQYIINRHIPNREIWMASPASGAWHFAHADGQWVSTREPRAVLTTQVAQELTAKYGVKVEL